VPPARQDLSEADQAMVEQAREIAQNMTAEEKQVVIEKITRTTLPAPDPIMVNQPKPVSVGVLVGGAAALLFAGWLILR